MSNGTRKITRALLALLIASFSTGWITPLFLAVEGYATGFEILLRGAERENSLPHLRFAEEALRLGSTWLLFSAVAWVTYGVWRLLSQARSTSPAG